VELVMTVLLPPWRLHVSLHLGVFEWLMVVRLKLHSVFVIGDVHFWT
jgi:hypothetical protein